MFRGSQIEKLVQLFRTRRVLLYHACQYQDLVSYLQLGGIPSRDLLKRTGLNTTPFKTDTRDRENGVWDKVFVNLEDYGRGFALGRAAVPNPYGPLLLRLRPSVLLKADDVAICLRSAGGYGFNRERESLKTVTEVDRIFWQPSNARRGSQLLKFKDGLVEEFGRKAKAVEISCTSTTGLLPLDGLCDVVADPYTIEGISLAKWTQQTIANSGLKTSVIIRKPEVGGSVYDEVAFLVRQRTPSLAEFPNLTTQNFLLDWANRVRSRNLEYQFRRFAEYLRIGTLDPVAAQAQKAMRCEYKVKLGHINDSYEYFESYEDVDPDTYEDVDPGTYEDVDFGIFEDLGTDKEENRLIVEKYYQDAIAWNRSHDEGGYYAD